MGNFLVDTWKTMFSSPSGVSTPEKYNFNPNAYLPDPAYQETVADLYDITQGQGPTVAERAGTRQAAAASRNAASLMASQRGMNPALAAKMAADQSAVTQAEIAGRAGEQAILERERGRQSLLNALEQNREALIQQQAIESGATNSYANALMNAQQSQSALDQAEQAKWWELAGNVGSMVASAQTGGASSAAESGMATSGNVGNQVGGQSNSGIGVRNKSMPMQQENIGLNNKSMPIGGANSLLSQMGQQAVGGAKPLPIQMGQQAVSGENAVYQGSPVSSNMNLQNSLYTLPNAERYNQVGWDQNYKLNDENERFMRQQINPAMINPELAERASKKKFAEAWMQQMKEGGMGTYTDIYGNTQTQYTPPAENFNEQEYLQKYPHIQEMLSYSGPTNKQMLDEYYNKKMKNKPIEVRNA